MPFRKPGTEEWAPKIELLVWDHRYFKLLTPFAYRPPGWSKDDEIVVPKHSSNGDKDVTDLASVPAVLWGLLPSYGRQLRAALMHDHLCEEVNRILESGDKKKAYTARRRADQLFWTAMRDPGDNEADLQKMVPWFRGRLFWAGVGLARYWKLRRVRAFLMTSQILLGSTALYLALWGDNPLAYLLTYVAALLLCVIWSKDAGIPVIGLLVTPVVVPVLLLTFVAQLLLAAPDLVIRIASRRPQPKPIVSPAFRKFRLPRRDDPPPAPGSLEPAS